jgi:succinyl-CoA synthetase beta subunit
MKVVMKLSKMYFDLDASLIEVNPLIKTKNGELVCLDAKIDFDDNALFRHKDILELEDTTQIDPLELESKKWDLNYVRLDGNIGCMVNGAGLAMATMDIIKYYGGEPANFLDVGGGATVERVAAAFKILLSDPKVKSVFVNIFGGIVRCDRIAGGIVEAAKQVKLDRPLIVRLEGTNVEIGRKMLEESGLNIIPAIDMADGAEKAVKAARGEI